MQQQRSTTSTSIMLHEDEDQTCGPEVKTGALDEDAMDVATQTKLTNSS